MIKIKNSIIKIKVENDAMLFAELCVIFKVGLDHMERAGTKDFFIDTVKDIIKESKKGNKNETRAE